MGDNMVRASIVRHVGGHVLTSSNNETCSCASTGHQRLPASTAKPICSRACTQTSAQPGRGGLYTLPNQLYVLQLVAGVASRSDICCCCNKTAVYLKKKLHVHSSALQGCTCGQLNIDCCSVCPNACVVLFMSCPRLLPSCKALHCEAACAACKGRQLPQCGPYLRILQRKLSAHHALHALCKGWKYTMRPFVSACAKMQ